MATLHEPGAAQPLDRAAVLDDVGHGRSTMDGPTHPTDPTDAGPLKADAVLHTDDARAPARDSSHPIDVDNSPDAAQPPPLVRPRSQFGDGLQYDGDHRFRAAFVRKVYALLSCQVSFTVAIMSLCMYTASLRTSMVLHSSAWLWGTGIPSFVCLLGLLYSRNKHPYNYYCFFAFTLTTGLNIGVVCAVLTAYGMATAVWNAALITGGLFISLTVYTFVSKEDFSWMGMYLYSGLSLLLIWGLMCWISGYSAGMGYALLGSCLFCGFIIYDVRRGLLCFALLGLLQFFFTFRFPSHPSQTWRLTHKYGYDDFLLASIDLYLGMQHRYVLRQQPFFCLPSFFLEM